MQGVANCVTFTLSKEGSDTAYLQKLKLRNHVKSKSN